MFRSLVTKHFVYSYREFCHAAIFIQTELSSGEKFVITILTTALWASSFP